MNKDDFEFMKMNLVGLREQFQSKHAKIWHQPSPSYLAAKTSPAPQNQWKPALLKKKKKKTVQKEDWKR